MCEGGGHGGERGGRLKMPLENGRADERVSRGQASAKTAVLVRFIGKKAQWFGR